MTKIRLGKTADSRTRRKPKEQHEETALLQKILNEKEQPSFKNYLLQKGYSSRSTETFENVTRRYLKWLNEENLEDTAASYNDILFYVQKKRSKISQRSVQMEINALKHYYNYLKQLGTVKENPTLNIQIKGIKRKKLYNIFSKKELEKLFNDYRNLESESLAHKRNQVVLSLLIYQGLTTTDLSRLKVKDLKLREGTIFIAGTRRSNDRTLKLESHQIMDFMEYQLTTRTEIASQQEQHSELLFMTLGRGKRFSNLLSKMLKQLKEIQPKLINVKQIRASVINGWLRMYNLREVQYMAGHRYVSSTEAYYVNDLEDLQDEIEKYHPMG
jgi:integrase/recombinase XerD